MMPSLRRSQRRFVTLICGWAVLFVTIFSSGCHWLGSHTTGKETVSSDAPLHTQWSGELDFGPWSSAVKNRREVIELILDSEGSFQRRVNQFKDWILSQGCRLVSEKNVRTSVPRRVDLEIRQGKKKIQIQIEQKISSQLALVIDDLGYNRKSLPLLENLNRSLTVAVLPQLTFSRSLAQTLHEKGFEIILHLPMESEAGLDPGPGALRLEMSDEEIRTQIEEDLKTVPFVVGVNNHMGSKVTQDRRVMKVVLEELGKKNLFFLDSLTAASVARDLAREEGWIVLGRDIFIDDQNNESDIRSKMEEIREKVLRKKRLIAIGHFRKGTLLLLQEYVEAFEDAGIQFVRLSSFYEGNANSQTRED